MDHKGVKMEANKRARVQLGRVLQSKAGNHRIELGQPRTKDGKVLGGANIFPITLADGTVLKEGDILTLKSPLAEIDNLVQSGKLDADVAEARKAAIPTFIKYNVTFDEAFNSQTKGL